MRRGACFFTLNAEAKSTTTRVSTITNNGSSISYTENKPYVNLIYTCQKSQAPMSFGHA
ncbi:hypothetical protein SH2C18_15280 [Clostridium sediminicola]|uniref:hypothetical protein n=1 Tax=Clostridium sediminicola TaxID=3114879 RepID=UPI0031F2405E